MAAGGTGAGALVGSDMSAKSKRDKISPALAPSRKRKVMLILMTLTLIGGLVVPLVLRDKVLDGYFPVAGGILGLLCSSYVIVSYLMNPQLRAPPLALLFWRSVADFGLAVRFVATPGFNIIICGASRCDFVDNWDMQASCGFASAMFEFFEISSEAWFLCVAIDLYLTMTRPFSRFEGRLKWYHIMSWGAGLAFSIPTGALKSIGGFWYVIDRSNNKVISTETFCWLQNESKTPALRYDSTIGKAVGVGGGVVDNYNHSLDWKPWVMFYIPLLSSYLFSLLVLYYAFQRLKTGVMFTFIHRLKVLFTNSINITTHILYWTFVLSLYASVFALASNGDTDARQLFNMLLFTIPAKGCSAVMVWVLVTSMDFGSDGDGASESLDLNTALREEVLLYASEGIRKTCRRAHLLNEKHPEHFTKMDEIAIALKQPESDADTEQHHDLITAWNFFMLVLGFQAQLKQLKAALTMKVQQRADVLTSFRVSVQEKRTSIAAGGPGADRALREHLMLDDMLEPIKESRDRAESRSSERDGDGDDSTEDGNERASTRSSGDGDLGGSGSRMSQRDTLNTQTTKAPSIDGSSKNISSSSTADVKKNPLHAAIDNLGDADSEEEDHAEDRNKFAPKPEAGASRPDSRRGSEKRSRPLSGSATDSGCNTPLSTPRGSRGLRKQHSDRNLRIHFVGDDEEEDENLGVIDEPLPETTWSEWLQQCIQSFFSALCCWCFAEGKEEEVEFKEYMPSHFRRVRSSMQLDDSLYRYLFLERVKERLTQGGASGAFFFFSKDEFLIAKSCTEEDVQVLTGNAVTYADYMTTNKESYISKVYGCYMLKIYGSKLYFMVMNNIFLNDRQHNKLVKYDIKGSWVKRNAELPRNGDTVTCKFCEQKYCYSTAKKKKRLPHVSTLQRRLTASGSSLAESVLGLTGLGKNSLSASNAHTSGSINSNASDLESVLYAERKEGCSATVDRQHEASVIYKDNDLREKILLPPRAAAALLRQLQADASYLHSVGVMDYSLLIGVHYTKYAVDADAGPLADDPDSNFMRPTLAMTGADDTSPAAASAALTDGRLSLDDKMLVEETKAMRNMQFCVPLEVGRVVGPDCYYMGIIDFQQKWTWSKRMERFAKVLFEGRDPDGLSAIDKDRYYHRFCEKMEDLLDLTADDDLLPDGSDSGLDAAVDTINDSDSLVVSEGLSVDTSARALEGGGVSSAGSTPGSGKQRRASTLVNINGIRNPQTSLKLSDNVRHEL